jgi:hypothetical protein
MKSLEEAAKEYCDREKKHIIVDASGIIPWETKETQLPHPVIQHAHFYLVKPLMKLELINQKAVGDE